MRGAAGLYEVALHHYADRDDTYSFDRLDAEVVQHIPILRENWVVSLRGLLQTTLDDDDQVPYFLLPSLGSGSTLRGYSSWRFRDRHSLLLSGEWRWIPNRLALDMALFYDAGMVAAAFDALSARRPRSATSASASGSTARRPRRLRIELAKGREGVRLVFAGARHFEDHRCMHDPSTVRVRAVCAALAASCPSRVALRRRAAASSTTTRSRASPRRRTRRRVQEWDIDLFIDLADQPVRTSGRSRRRTCARATSTPSTKCRTRAGSPTASWRGR